jgi:hypothetical protein
VSTLLLEDMEAGFEEHPLCSDPEGSDEQDEEEAKEGAPSLAPTRSTQSKTRAVDSQDESEGGRSIRPGRGHVRRRLVLRR